MEFLLLIAFCIVTFLAIGVKLSIGNIDFRDRYDFRCYCPKHGDMPWRHSEQCKEFKNNE